MLVDFQTERKIEVNRWIIKSRWLYIFGIFAIGALTKTISQSNINFPVTEMAFVILILMALKREIMLEKQTQKLNQESQLRDAELIQLDQTAKLLVARDGELSEINTKLDEKIKELETSKISLMKVLKEIQDAKNKSEEEKNKTMAIISNFTDPIIVLDKENKIVLFNLAAKIALGLRNSDLGIEMPAKNDFSLENFKSVIRKKFEFKKLKTDKKSDLLTEELYIKEGSETTYKVITVNIRDSWGNYTGIMKIFYDFTREKIIDKMKSDFISIAAHQLRTPLSVIKWSTGMLLDGDAGSLNLEQENLLRKSYVSNEVMINLVNDLLNVSRIEEGRFGYDFNDISIQEIINTVIENSKQLIEKNSIKVDVKNEEEQTLLCLDKIKITLAIQNILDNAIKYSPHYGGRIDITVKKTSDNYLSISVKDNGIGIPKKEQEKLFSKFFRASNVVLMETEGTGLGLFIVRNIIEKHGGNVSIISEANKGTEVIVKLPIECKI